MNRTQRAHIFQSFDALKGYQELLCQKEKIKVEKRILSEDDCEILNRKVKRIQKGMILTVVYHEKTEYIQMTGMVAKINLENGFVQIVKKKIWLKDIVDMQADELDVLF